jgi:hypothetical protein
MFRILLTGGTRVRGFASGIRVAEAKFPADLSGFAESEEWHGIAALPSVRNLVFRHDGSRASRCRAAA